MRQQQLANACGDRLAALAISAIASSATVAIPVERSAVAGAADSWRASDGQEAGREVPGTMPKPATQAPMAKRRAGDVAGTILTRSGQRNEVHGTCRGTIAQGQFMGEERSGPPHRRSCAEIHGGSAKACQQG